MCFALTATPLCVHARLVDCDGGRVFRLEKPVVSLGRQEAKQADILVEAEQDKRGSFFCSSIQFELRHADGRATVVDRSANGTFLNIDEAGFADANAAAPSGVFKTPKQEQTWLKAQFPNPRLVKGADTDIADGDALYSVLAPIYEKHFNLIELNQLVSFYESPLGQKLVRISPELLTESLDLGQQWGMSLVPEIVSRVRARMNGASAASLAAEPAPANDDYPAPAPAE